MKRTLVLGCAAVAFAATCGTASAQTKFEMKIGGDAYFQGAYVDQKRDEGLRSVEFANRFRLVITPKATTDNGLAYGGRVRLRANNGSGTLDADRAFIFAEGGFGTVQAGVINGLSDEFAIIGPNVEGIAGGPDNNTVNFLSGSSTSSLLPTTTNNFRAFASGDNGTKVIYLTPEFSGFKAGVAYTPQMGDVGSSVNRVKNSALFHDMVEFGGYYTGDYGAWTADASAFYQTGEAATGFKDLSSVSVGADVGFSGFKFGGTYAYSGDSGYADSTANKKKQTVWTINGQYTMGPVILALSYLHSTGNNVADYGSFAAGTVPAKADMYQAGVTYSIAPGLSTGLEYSYVKLNTDLTTAQNGGVDPDDHAHIIMIDTRLAF